MSNESFAIIASAELEHVTGGVAKHHAHAHAHAPAAPTGIAGFFDGLYKKLVFHFASDIAGPKLADKMYGGHASAADKQRASDGMKQFLAGGNKLPKGVPNLFGG